MDTLLIQNKNKKSNKVKIIIITTVLFLIILGIGAGAYYIYSNQIVDSENISMSVSQNANVDLPKTVETGLRNAKKLDSIVKWSASKIATDKVGTVNITGEVKGYSKLVTLTVNIYPYIVSSEEVNISIVQNNTDWIWELPESINVKYSNGTIKTNSVSWDNKNVDISKPGFIIIKGDITSSIDLNSKLQATCKVTITAENKLVKEMIIKNEFSDSINIKCLTTSTTFPEKLVQRVYNAGTRIEFVKDKIHFNNLYVPSGLVEGLYSSEEALITIYCDNGFLDYGTLLHELGHAIDWTATSNDYTLSIRNNKFIKIYNKEVKNLFANDNYYLKQPEEYFAECFSMYYFSAVTNDELKKHAPQTFDYIKSIK